jgi:Chalcone isomerase-like
MHRRILLAASAAALLAGLTPARAQAPAPTELAGVKYPPSVQVAGSNLVLNGAGIRYKFIIKVYTAGLYMANKAATAEAVLAAPGNKRMHVVMLRDIDGNELGKLFTRGMQDNAPKGEFSKFIPGMLQMADIFSTRRKLVAGDYFSVDYVPGTGTQVLVNGKPTGEVIKEPEFFNALMRIWIGPSPADRLLKDALLGQTPSNSLSRSQ